MKRRIMTADFFNLNQSWEFAEQRSAFGSRVRSLCLPSAVIESEGHSLREIHENSKNTRKTSFKN